MRRRMLHHNKMIETILLLCAPRAIKRLSKSALAQLPTEMLRRIHEMLLPQMTEPILQACMRYTPPQDKEEDVYIITTYRAQGRDVREVKKIANRGAQVGFTYLDDAHADHILYTLSSRSTAVLNYNEAEEDVPFILRRAENGELVAYGRIRLHSDNDMARLYGAAGVSPYAFQELMQSGKWMV